MELQKNINFSRIAKAIEYIRTNFKSQPDLEEIASNVHLSPYHFQRLFTEWAGTSPKKFLQYISLEYAKKILKENQSTLSDVAWETGLSGTGRLHDLFINIEGMTPAEYKNGGEKLVIQYDFSGSPFGNVLIASTQKGICHISFTEDPDKALKRLQSTFPKAVYSHHTDKYQKNALAVFAFDGQNRNPVKLHLKGTDFQLKVWEALLKIPMGQLSTYGNVARQIYKPKASRAVGSAIGENPVAFLIPCHRVIQSSGVIGGYMWGATRKTAILGWEAARAGKESNEQS